MLTYFVSFAPNAGPGTTVCPFMLPSACTTRHHGTSPRYVAGAWRPSASRVARGRCDHVVMSEELVERVLSVIEQIPPGRVLSYGDVAELASAPTPRYVGQVLAWHGDAVPWWRVLRADGTPAPHLRQRQLSLLRAEGTPVLPSGEAVDLRRARWAATTPDPPSQPGLF